MATAPCRPRKEALGASEPSPPRRRSPACALADWRRKESEAGKEGARPSRGTLPPSFLRDPPLGDVPVPRTAAPVGSPGIRARRNQSKGVSAMIDGSLQEKEPVHSAAHPLARFLPICTRRGRGGQRLTFGGICTEIKSILFRLCSSSTPRRRHARSYREEDGAKQAQIATC